MCVCVCVNVLNHNAYRLSKIHYLILSIFILLMLETRFNIQFMTFYLQPRNKKSFFLGKSLFSSILRLIFSNKTSPFFPISFQYCLLISNLLRQPKTPNTIICSTRLYFLSFSTLSNIQITKVTLYAIWRKTITVTYNANGGSGAPGSQSINVFNSTTSGSITISSTKPTRSGYTFLGWSTSSTATSASYASGTAYSFSNSVTLYAVWKDSVVPNVATISLPKIGNIVAVSYTHLDVYKRQH